MQPDERVDVGPVPARALAPVDDDDVGVAVRDQCVRERQPTDAGADDEVVGVQVHAHSITQNGE